MSITVSTKAQTLPTASWRGELQREDGNNIVFTFDSKTEKGKPVIYIKNAEERIPVTNIKFQGDSIIMVMPVFESTIRAKKVSAARLEGTWIKNGATKYTKMPFVAIAGNAPRFPISNSGKAYNIGGRWSATFVSKDEESKLIGEFRQQGSKVYGTFLTTSGDYRYLDGTVAGDTLRISGFDGGHSYFFRAHIANDSTITDGVFASAATYKETWTAKKDSKATLPLDASAAYLKKGEERLNFTFPRS